MMRWIDPERLLTAIGALLLAAALAFVVLRSPDTEGSAGLVRRAALVYRAQLKPPGSSNPFTPPPAPAPSPQLAPSASVSPPVEIATPSPVPPASSAAGPAVTFDPSRYRVTGVFAHGDDKRAVILEIAANKQSIYWTGEYIDGAEIVNVDFSRVDVRVGEQVVSLKVEGSKGAQPGSSGSGEP